TKERNCEAGSFLSLILYSIILLIPNLYHRLSHTSIYKFHGNIHTLCNLFWCHPTIQETLADHFHVFAHFNYVLVWVIETYNTLSPRMFYNRVNILDFIFF